MNRQRKVLAAKPDKKCTTVLKSFILITSIYFLFTFNFKELVIPYFYLSPATATTIRNHADNLDSAKEPTLNEYDQKTEEMQQEAGLDVAASYMYDIGDIDPGSVLKFETCGWVPNKTVGQETLLQRMEHSSTCKDIFKRWMAVNLKTAPTGPLPRDIPTILRARYTLNNTVPVQYLFKDDRTNKIDKTVWTSQTTGEFVKLLKSGKWDANYYGTDSVAHAMNLYKPRGQGLIIGSLVPWVEATAIFSGADHVLTATYESLQSTDSRITAIHPTEMALDYKKYLNTFDFAVSYSSIEHSGLGRYGDNLDPEGDILEMQKVRCWLKDGGLFYLGLPSSVFDTVVWNVHRVYGPLRLSYMYSGFDIVSVFEPRGGNQLTLKQALDTSPVLGDALNQPTVVLRKTNMTRNC